MSRKDIISKEIEQAEAERLFHLQRTVDIKKKFISEIKTGLGDEIKKNPNGIIIHKKKKNVFSKLLDFFVRILKKF